MSVSTRIFFSKCTMDNTTAESTYDLMEDLHWSGLFDQHLFWLITNPKWVQTLSSRSLPSSTPLSPTSAQVSRLASYSAFHTGNSPSTSLAVQHTYRLRRSPFACLNIAATNLLRSPATTTPPCQCSRSVSSKTYHVVVAVALAHSRYHTAFRNTNTYSVSISYSLSRRYSNGSVATFET